VSLDPDGLRLLAAVAAEAGEPARQVTALEALGERSPNPDERVRSLLSVASLRTQGPDALRDPAAAEAALHRVLAERPGHAEAFEKLGRLLEDAGRHDALAALLEGRIALETLAPEEVCALALRIARLDVERSRAIAALRVAVDQGAAGEALVEELYGLLVEAGDVEACAALCEAQTRAAPGKLRGFWARRWLRALERLDRPPAEELAVVESMLESAPGAGALVERQIRLLRELGRPRELALSLERALEMSASAESPHRALHLRELLALLEGPLDEPARALDWIESCTDASPQLLARGARLAERLDDRAREIGLLSRLLATEGGSDTLPGLQRRLGLALWRSGALAEAEPLLRRSLAVEPRDVEVVEALEGVERRKDDPAGLAQILELKFAVQPDPDRISTAREGFQQAERAGDPRAALRWLRREHALVPLPLGLRRRRAELERGFGDASGLLDALIAVAEVEEHASARASALASAAYLHEDRGDLELARRLLAQALEMAPDPAAPWLEAQDRILSRLGKVAERSEVLSELAVHPDLDPEQRERHGSARLELMTGRPELHEAAVAELERRVRAAGDPPPADALRELLGLYDSLARVAEWCGAARRLVPLLDGPEREALERELARRTGDAVGDRAAAIEIWEQLLERSPDDVEALERLSSLLSSPGVEARRARVLERRADGLLRDGDPDPERRSLAVELLLEAARLRFESLGDPAACLSCVDRLLELEPRSAPAHVLRARACARLQRFEEELTSLRVLLAAGSRVCDVERVDRTELWLRMAQILADRPDRQAETERALEACLAAGPAEPALLAEVREVLEQIGRFGRAIALLRQEIELAAPEACPALLREVARLAWEGTGDAATTRDALEALSEQGPLDATDEQRLSEALEKLGALGRRPRGAGG
jgi:tetratricopeptide (TPR) repeat protein